MGNQQSICSLKKLKNPELMLRVTKRWCNTVAVQRSKQGDTNSRSPDTALGTNNPVWSMRTQWPQQEHQPRYLKQPKVIETIHFTETSAGTENISFDERSPSRCKA